ncbi:DUF2478 domain-containing protein [Bradyrhizobium sp. BRP20]|nr:DUF2478 domain-containing protein [Bradyrhizobium sp. BRP20]
MIDDLDQIRPYSVGAIRYRPKDDADRLLAQFAQDIAQQGLRFGGIVQRHSMRANVTHVMLTIDVATGQEISISQPLSSGGPVISVQMRLPRPQLSFPRHFATSSIFS